MTFSPNLISLLSSYVMVAEDRPIMSIKYCLPVPIFHFWPKLTHPVVLSLSLCHSWASCCWLNSASYCSTYLAHSLWYYIEQHWYSSHVCYMFQCSFVPSVFCVLYHWHIMWCAVPRVGPGCVLCPRIDPLHFLAGCRRRRLNQGLVVALGFFLVVR